MPMKKFLAILIAVAMMFLLAGCSFSLYRREEDSRDIYKDYIAIEEDSDSAYTQRVAAKKGAAVVSIIANSIIQTNRGSASVVQIYSGVIINSEGYVLTTSQAAQLQVSSGNRIYSNEVMSAYAVLPEVYDDSHHYKLTLVDYDSDAGLALFRFYDRFHYYTDETRQTSEDGFQIVAEFSAAEILTGARSVGIGNSLGNALNEGVIVPDRINEIAQTVMGGIVSDAEADATVLEPITYGGNKYTYILTTAPVNIDMYGGALFDENGYLIGLLAMKIGYESETTRESGYFKRVGAAYRVSLLTEFIDTVAESIHSPIPYTLASAANKEAA